MADLLQVAAPVTPKNYTNISTRPVVQNDEVFDLVDLSKVLKPSDRSEQFSQQDATEESASGAISRLSVLVSKDPSLVSSSLKALLGADVLRELQESGNVELLNKLYELAGDIMLSPETAISDLGAQQKSATIFNGEFFDILRAISQRTTNPEIKNAVIAVLKSISSASSGADILRSLSENFKFLSERLSPSKSLSAELLKLSGEFGAPGAAENFAELKSRALQMLAQVNSSLLVTEKVKSILPLITHNLSRFSDNYAGVKDSFNSLLELLGNKDLKAALSKAFLEYAESAQLPLETKLEIFGEDSPQAQKLAADAQMRGFVDDLSLDAKAAAQGLDVEQFRAKILEAKSLKEILMNVIPARSEGKLDSLIDDFASTKDLNALLQRLSQIVDSIDSAEVKTALAGRLNEILSRLAASEGLKYSAPSSMENFADFLAKNIADPSLRSLGAMSQNEMLQSLLTAPGVFTPLLHYLMPMQIDDTKSFGELWVDNYSGSDDDGERENRLFLSFSIESIGDFELEILEKKKELSVSLLCPPQIVKSFSKFRETASKIAAANGYYLKSASAGALKEKRNLVDVFPKIKEKRAGFNVTV
ncbi:MAG: hypothetical protein JG769_1554 [Oscillospiraceae bacterium]|jgi:hypothetical protein|nr:hypothetical protein [Oscillospiraceae bacterium]